MPPTSADSTVDLELPDPAGPPAEPPGKPPYCFLFRPDTATHSGAVGWLGHLRSRGFVVLRGVATPAAVATAADLLWRDIEAAEGISRANPGTWGAWRRLTTSGLVADMAQTEGAWHVRGLSAVKRAFASIWETAELLTSMDAVILWRPWSADGAGDGAPAGWPAPRTEGLHIDQNPFSKPGLDCVQGMMPLLPVTASTGGLAVVPGSHTDEAKAVFKQRYARMEHQGDWCPLDSGDPIERDSVLLLADAGDLILWDSRTVHGGVVGTGQPSPFTEMARMSVTVAMTPAALASDAVRQRRREGFAAGRSFNHCPHEAGTSSGTIKASRKAGYGAFELSPEQLALL